MKWVQLDLFKDTEPIIITQYWCGLPCADMWWFDLLSQGMDITDLWPVWLIEGYESPSGMTLETYKTKRNESKFHK